MFQKIRLRIARNLSKTGEAQKKWKKNPIQSRESRPQQRKKLNPVVLQKRGPKLGQMLGLQQSRMLGQEQNHPPECFGFVWHKGKKSFMLADLTLTMNMEFNHEQ